LIKLYIHARNHFNSVETKTDLELKLTEIAETYERNFQEATIT